MPLVVCREAVPQYLFGLKAVPELVRPGATGCLAKLENINDLCRGIVQLLEDDPVRHSMKRQCREVIVNEYSLELQIQRYIEMYRHLLNN